MNNNQYLAVDVEDCRRKGHHFTIAGSDKTPMKRNLICDTCSGKGKTAYAAYGDETKSFGQWSPPLRRNREE
jgi:hypothetical protein